MGKVLKNESAVKAIFEDKFHLFLKNIGIYDDIQNGTIKCKFCGDTITFDNIASVFPESGSVKVVCDKPECICEMNNYLNEK